jgi:hypothetical protein
MATQKDLTWSTIPAFLPSWATLGQQVALGALRGASRRKYRLPLLLLFTSILAFSAGLFVAGSWAISVIACEAALMFDIERLRRNRTSAREASAVVTAAGLTNLLWAAGPVTMWLCAPGMREIAALWLAGHLSYHMMFHRAVPACFMTAIAPPAMAFLVIEASSFWKSPLLAVQFAAAVMLVAFFGYVATAEMRKASSRLLR